MATVTFEPEAEDELEAAMAWYEQRVAGLGLRLVLAIDEAVARIAALPQACSEVPRVRASVVVRRARVAGFPYSVAFVELENELRVIAIAQMDVVAPFDPERWWVEADVRARLLPGVRRELRAGRYLIQRLIGSGGVGVVFEAFDPALRRTVAVKILRASGHDQDFHAAIRSEARALAQVDDPHVVKVLSVGEFEDVPMIVMELLAGPPLSTWLAERKRPWQEVVARFAEAGRGLAAAHRAGLVHGDFKADNVLFTSAGPVQVVDFGLAREAARRDGGSAGTRLSGGTEHAMSPEQRDGATVDARSDQYSFCVALRDALVVAAGRPPSRIERAIARGLALRPDERWPDMASLLAALRVRSRGTATAVAAAGLACAALVAAAMPSRERDQCATLPAPTWDETTRERIAEALRSAVPPTTPSASAHLGETLAQFDARLAEISKAVCEEHRLGRTSPARHDTQRLCLDGQRARVEAMLAAAQRDNAVAFVEAISRDDLRVPAPDDCKGADSDHAAPSASGRTVLLELQRAHGLSSAGARVDGAAEAGEAVARARELGEPHVLAEALLTWSKLLTRAGELARAGRVAEEAYTVAAEAGAALVAARAAATIAAATFRSDHGATEHWARIAEAWFDRARTPVGDPDRLQLAITIASAMLHSGRIAAALEPSRAALARVEATGSDDEPLLVTANSLVSEVYDELGQLAEAEDYGRRAIAHADRRADRLADDPVLPAALRLNLAAIVMHAGRLEEGRDILLDVNERFATTLPPGHPHRMFAMLALVDAHRLLGDWERLRPLLDEAAIAVDAAHEARVQPYLDLARSRLAVHDRRADEARTLALRAHRAAEDAHGAQARLCEFRLQVAEAELLGNRLDEARMWLAACRELAIDGTVYVTDAMLTEGALAAAAGLRAAATRHIDDAVARADDGAHGRLPGAGRSPRSRGCPRSARPARSRCRAACRRRRGTPCSSWPRGRRPAGDSRASGSAPAPSRGGTGCGGPASSTSSATWRISTSSTPRARSSPTAIGSMTRTGSAGRRSPRPGTSRTSTGSSRATSATPRSSTSASARSSTIDRTSSAPRSRPSPTSTGGSSCPSGARSAPRRWARCRRTRSSGPTCPSSRCCVAPRSSSPTAA